MVHIFYITKMYHSLKYYFFPQPTDPTTRVMLHSVCVCACVCVHVCVCMCVYGSTHITATNSHPALSPVI